MTSRHVWAALAAALVIPACSAAGSTPGFEQAATDSDAGTGPACTPGSFLKCTCGTGQEGTRQCNDKGAYGDCGPCPAITDKPRCGDNVCQAGETCDNCKEDCGQCPLCDKAPSCNKAMIPSGSMTPMPGLNVKLDALTREQILDRMAQKVAEGGTAMRIVAAALDAPHAGENTLVPVLREVFAKNPRVAESMKRNLGHAGMISPSHYRLTFPEPSSTPPQVMNGEFPEPSCGAPMLRIRVAKVQVVEEDDDFANDIVYCAVSAEAQVGAELRVTPRTPNLDEGKTHLFSLESGVVWGQKAPRAAEGNLLLTYDCFEQDDNSSYSNLLKSLGDAATKAGGVIGGEYGWVFGVAGIVANLAGSALALDGDDHLFNATQTIPASEHLKMTNGATWQVRRKGTNGLSDWDWILHMEAWGCAKYGGLNP